MEERDCREKVIQNEGSMNNPHGNLLSYDNLKHNREFAGMYSKWLYNPCPRSG